MPFTPIPCRPAAGRINRAVTSLLLLTVLLGAGGCREAGQRMDVRLDLRLEDDAPPVAGPVELTFRWQMATDAEPVSSDYLVFAHFVDQDGEIRWQDDHDPPVPTSQWQPGQVVEYTRIHFVPESTPLQEISLIVGLFDHHGTGEKVKLAGSPAHEVARFVVLPATRLPMIIFEQGWHNQEFAPGQLEDRGWRWSRREAVCWVESPGRPCSLFLDLQAPMTILETAQPVILELEGTELAAFTLDSPDRVVRKIPIPRHQVQDKECLRLVLSTDRVVIPIEMGISNDQRELGLKVYRLVVY